MYIRRMRRRMIEEEEEKEEEISIKKIFYLFGAKNKNM